MHFRLKIPWFPLLLIFLIIVSISQSTIKKVVTGVTPIPTPSPDLPLGRYEPPSISSTPSYTIFFAGDSMTTALGPEPNLLRKYIESDYPGKIFGLFNYSQPSTNVVSFEKRLTEETNNGQRTLPPILNAYYDVIIIESFGHNPLSNHPLQEGLIVQNQELEKNVKRLITAQPNSLIVFLATIPPSRETYAKGVVDLSPEVRRQWAEERIAYIENHIKFASDHNIPLINVYQKSQDENGNVQNIYIDGHDNIHPSIAGIELITSEIRGFLNGVLPK